MNNERAHCATLSNGTVVAQDSTASSTLNAAPRRRSTFVGGLVALAGICSLLMGCVAGESDFRGRLR
ncbi:MAG: hypothetical protein R3F14_26210 [Polyangiaceae bacterium]